MFGGISKKKKEIKIKQIKKEEKKKKRKSKSRKEVGTDMESMERRKRDFF